jgi:hypothetical protein
MRYASFDAPPLLAASGSGLRPVARRVAHSFRRPASELVARARLMRATDIGIGRVHSAGAWTDASVHGQIVASLDLPLQPALRQAFEWYLCRGAFFHTDAHYSNVLFGVWYIDGPAVDITFARAGIRVGADPGTLVIFDPFEVHGVLLPGATAYRAEDYLTNPGSVFVGFELELDESVRASFDITAVPSSARVISSATRVSSTSGAFE